MIPLRSGFLRRLIAAALTVPSLWNVAMSGQPSTATVVALDPGVTAGASFRGVRPAVLLEGQGDYVELRASVIDPDMQLLV
jgi:hypothetical protein